ncbi:hypothetical protein GN244_ATG12548 [Phytophthora infestans]|uniref:Uncharacterized protein n=1 Tax=Phytophthora infestans TaxID=4787 RepID=A0A833VZH5_PHYIN|nr:hypothetical protein GN244_ATG12548 [Phytophthora infestans]KAF4144413.1 hypothetical protein GN958_ATG06423 [Phytophthora infestans]
MWDLSGFEQAAEKQPLAASSSVWEVARISTTQAAPQSPFALVRRDGKDVAPRDQAAPSGHP